MDGCPPSSATTATTITLLQTIFATHGIPELLVSDNGSVFTSVDFNNFVQTNGVRHTTSAPYHPSTNGLAERAVQTSKVFMKKAPNAPLEDSLSRFLFQYQIAPHSTTGISPAELLFKRRPRSKLDLILPDLQNKIHSQQQKQKAVHDCHAVSSKFIIGDNVLVCDLPSKKDWLPGIIEGTAGPKTFNVLLTNGQTVRRHLDHLHHRPTAQTPECNDSNDPTYLDLPGVQSTRGMTPRNPATQRPAAIPNPSLHRSTRVSISPDQLIANI